MRFMTGRVWGLLASVLFVGSVVAAQEGSYRDLREWPDTYVGGLAKELVEIINAGDKARAIEFIDAYYDPEVWKDFPTEANAAWLVDLKKAHGKLEFHSTRVYDEPPDPGGKTADFVVAILYSQNKEQWMGLSLQLGHGDPGKVRGMVIMPARAPSEVAAEASPLTREAFAKELDDYLRRMTDADRFSGAVLVAKGDEVLFERAYGLANRSWNAPNRTATRFSLGSMNKMVTAVATAQLVEQGRLRYEDTIDRHLPKGWLDPELAQRIKIEHLLSHTSGLGDYLAVDAFWNGAKGNFRTLEDFKPLFAEVELAFEPGTDWAYSNSGFLLLGVIVGHVGGKGYDAYVEEHVYRPAGMTDTRFFELDQPEPDLATGYYRDPDDGTLRNNLFLRTVRGGPAGGGYSTVQDLYRFGRALTSGKLVNAESRKRLWTATELSKKRMPYGAGFIIGGTEGDLRVGHGGTFPGVTANLSVHVDGGWTVVVLCNLSGGVGAGDVTNKISEWIARVE